MPTARILRPAARHGCLRLPHSALLTRRHITTPITTSPLNLTLANPYLDLTPHSHAPLPAPSSLTIFPNFLSQDTQFRLATLAEKKLRRLCGKAFWAGHFDGVTKEYRECSVRSWGVGVGGGDDVRDVGDEDLPGWVLGRVKRTVEAEVGSTSADAGGADGKIQWLDPHILELAENGEIRAHVDNVEASGSIVTGLCLLSPAVMIFRKVSDSSTSFTALMEPGTLYVQRDALRYDYTHEIPVDGQLRMFRGSPVPRGRRISIMMRDALKG
ncbi:uncharacterized protein EV422DRAFT_572138 [Fimicolochytrium jonesii]|uniref:uncharacterized protein n=1 Tax=Fimicolochytrium jonesii TaxID=1396493 RepID=UPI0022FDDB67|nr:uncharacterized protein EV422DRAFT_572138 [Fimicolochytrium jonesii]KAI8816077.1 hypothetical protein EV422DRAFT_572138 [Fimicolochytrium jonesii]